MNNKVFNIHESLARLVADDPAFAEEFILENQIPVEDLYDKSMTALLNRVSEFKLKEGKVKQAVLQTKFDTFIQKVREFSIEQILEIHPPLAGTYFSKLSEDGISDADIEILKSDSSFLHYLEKLEDDFTSGTTSY